MEFDVAVIGAGPGGYVAAIKSAQLGLRTVIIEKDKFGGVCLNCGCIPTKALLHSAHLYKKIQHSNDFGIKVGNVEFDLPKIIKRSREIANKLGSGVKYLLNKNKIEIISGSASINKNGDILVGNDQKTPQIIKAKNIIIATGARARTPEIEVDGVKILTYKEAMLQEKLPKNLLVVGAGAIGVEFTSFYNSLGSNVVLVEAMPSILPIEDAEISQILHKSLEADKVKIFTSSKIKKITKNQKNVHVVIEDNKGAEHKMEFDAVIYAIGIVPNTENLGIEDVGIALDARGHIVTDEYMQTSQKNIYAIGDVTKGPWLAHKASHEAIIAALHIAGKRTHSMNTMNIPSCTYAHPQVASIGITEKRAMELGIEIRIGRFPYAANGKALCTGEDQGMVKTIFNAKTGELIGAHMIGADVTEMIGSFSIGRELEATDLDFINTIFPHPTMSESIHESVLDAFEIAIHI